MLSRSSSRTSVHVPFAEGISTRSTLWFALAIGQKKGRELASEVLTS